MFGRIILLAASFCLLGVGVHTLVTGNFIFVSGAVATGPLAMAIGITSCLFGICALYYVIKGGKKNHKMTENEKR